MAEFQTQSEQDTARIDAMTRSFFYLLGDVMGGVDASARIDSTTIRSDGLLGPGRVTVGDPIGISQEGNVFVRGRTTGGASAPAIGAASGGGVALNLSPSMIMLAVGAFFLLRR